MPKDVAKKKQKKQEDSANVHAANTPTDNENQTFNLNVSVLDLHGKPILGLAKEDFKLFVDGNETEIVSVSHSTEPVNFIFLIDASPSAETKTNEVSKRAMMVLGQLSLGDRAMVIKFDTDLQVVAKLTDDLQVAGKAIQKTRMRSGTALYDHIRHLAEKIIPTITGRTAVLLFSDGVDTVSRRANYQTSLELAEALDAVFYTVYFDTLSTALATTGALGSRQLQAMGFPPIPGLSTDPKQIRWEYQMGINYINDLASLSGGRAVRAETLDRLTAAPVNTIPSEVRNRYIVTLNAPVNKKGKRHELQVRVNRPNLVILARGSLLTR